MNEKNLFLEFFALYRQELGYGFIAAALAAARHWQQGDDFRTIVTNSFIVAAIAFGMNTILHAFGIDGHTWGYLASVSLGYVGHKVFVVQVLDRLTGIITGKERIDVQTRNKKP